MIFWQQLFYSMLFYFMPDVWMALPLDVTGVK